ncbi:MAG: hypothetical protein JWN69_122, partial [Alphaproteobacteria bacterium]|nr:hypothetical protein [Alphaproteobacteria bacterium]
GSGRNHQRHYSTLTTHRRALDDFRAGVK